MYLPVVAYFLTISYHNDDIVQPYESKLASVGVAYGNQRPAFCGGNLLRCPAQIALT